MGIRGLLTFVEDNQDKFLVDCDLRSSTIIVDANNVLNKLYDTCTGSNAAFGCDYEKVYSHFKNFCSSLDSCKVKPIMVFDGGLSVDNRKEMTRKTRTSDRMTAGISCNPFCQERNNVLPLFVKHIFTAACKEYKFQVVQCDYEADEEIALLSCNLKYPVLSGDSDFMIYGIQLILYDPPRVRFSWCNKLESNVISCKMFDTDRFFQKFYLVERKYYPFVGIILGNDYIRLESLEFMSTKTRNKDINGRLEDISKWLKSQKDPTSASEKVCVFLFLSRDANENVFPNEH